MNSPVFAACAVLFLSLVAVASWSQDDAVAAPSSGSTARMVPAGIVLDRHGRSVRVVLPSPY